MEATIEGDITTLPEWAQARFAELELLANKHIVSKRSDDIKVPPATPNQLKFLHALMRHPDRFKRYEFLIETVWGDDPNGGPENPANGLRVMVFNLRKRLKSFGMPDDWIETSWGYGYRVKEDHLAAMGELLSQHIAPMDEIEFDESAA